MKHIQVVAAIIVYNNDNNSKNNCEILCMRRGPGKHDYLTGKYEFPGGKIEPGEKMPQALMRELKEEMDLDVEIRDEDFYMTVNHMYPDFEITLHSFVCRVGDKKFVRREHVEHKWLKAEQLGGLDWATADMPIVKKIAAGGLWDWS